MNEGAGGILRVCERVDGRAAVHRRVCRIEWRQIGLSLTGIRCCALVDTDALLGGRGRGR